MTNRRIGFTLVELLVVIAILSILMSFLLPVLGHVRDAARSASCMSNLKQQHLCTVLYADDAHGFLPPGHEWPYGPSGGFVPDATVTIFSFIRSEGEAGVLTCPAREAANGMYYRGSLPTRIFMTVADAGQWVPKSLQYAPNSRKFVRHDPWQRWALQHIRALKRPEKIFVTTDGDGQGFYWSDDWHGHPYRYRHGKNLNANVIMFNGAVHTWFHDDVYQNVDDQCLWNHTGYPNRDP